jgi:hypothetical protein
MSLTTEETPYPAADIEAMAEKEQKKNRNRTEKNMRICVFAG